MICPLLLLASLVLFAAPQQGNALAHLHGVKEYEVVYPQKLYARHRRDTGAKYPDEVQYGLQVQGKDMVMHLERNEDLFAQNYTLTYRLPDGQEVTITPPTEDHCYYHGFIKNETDSEASISICKGVRGYFKSKGERYLIEPLKLEEGEEEHAVYKQEDLENTENTPKTCGVTNTTYEKGSKMSRSATSTQKKAFLEAKKYVELYMIADNSVFKKYAQSTKTVESRIFEIINYVNLVYKAINTFVALTGIDIWSDKDQFELNTSAGVDLDRFSAWRTAVLLKKKYHDNAQFLTNTDFDGPTVGLAFVGTMCSSDHSTGVIQDHSASAISVGATIAHEMGHNLGMNHDTSSCTCAEDSCIMAASLSYVTPKLFSTCSHQQFQDFILSKMPMCLQNKPSLESIIAPPVCGNGFVESGEQCDCGLPQECTNPCCNAATCKLMPEAKCADGECCENCKIKAGGNVCRRSKDDCDLSENCDGVNANCPADRFRVNGYPCNNGQGSCFQGMCPTLQGQCTDFWGAGAVVSESRCYNQNTKGNYYGFCAYSGTSYIACKPQDVQCGKLYCSGGASTISIFASVVKLGECKVVVTATGVVDSLGMVMNGTSCGIGQVCSMGQCVDLVKAYPRAVNCSNNCKGHAVCNNDNVCQCEEGWAPPSCDAASGQNIIIIIVVVILIALTIILVLGLLWYRGVFARKDQSSQPDGVINRGYQAKNRSPPVTVHTPEMNAADGRQPQTRVGYSSPQYVVQASPNVEQSRTHFENKPVKPNTAPPPIPVSKPGNYGAMPRPPPPVVKPVLPPTPPKGAMPKPPPPPVVKPVLPPAPPKALKPPTK